MRFDPASFISWSFFALFFLALTYIIVHAGFLFWKYRSRTQNGISREIDPILTQVGNDVRSAIWGVWTFLRPILQLIIVLAIGYWFATTAGIDRSLIAQFQAADVKTTLAIFVIGAFCLAAFLSESPASWLKDLALVVIGFYFGTKVGGG